MMNQCPHCHSTAKPISKMVWSKKDKLIAVILCILFVPVGLFYILVKRSNGKQDVCPVCGKPYAEVTDTDLNSDFEMMKQAAKNIANDPEVRKRAKDLHESTKELHDTFYVN